MKKQIKAWANVYQGYNGFYATRELADAVARSAEDSDRIACVELTGEYEVPEQTVTITESQVEAALQTMAQHAWSLRVGQSYEPKLKEIKKELGFKND